MKKSVKIPKELMEEKIYRNLTNGARILFGILSDLKKRSGRRDWIDGRGYRYVLLPKKKMKEALNCSRYAVDKYTRELELTGLIRFEYIRTPLYERRIYVRSFDPQTTYITIEYTAGDNTNYQEQVSGEQISMPTRESSDQCMTKDLTEKAVEDILSNKHLSRWQVLPPKDCPMTRSEAAILTLRNIRMMTCILEEMIGEVYEKQG